MPTYSIKGPDGKTYSIDGPEGASKEEVISAIQDQFLEAQVNATRPDYGLGEGLSKAFTRGTTQLGSAFGDVLPAAVASSLGFDEYAKKQMEEAKATQDYLNIYNKPEVPSYKDVKDIGSGLTYFGESVAEQAPNLLTSLIPGVGGELLAAKMGASRAAGAGVGVYLGSYAQNYPEVFQNIYDATGKMEPGAAAIATTASAALDSALPAYILRKFTGPAKAGLVEELLKKSGMEAGLARKAISILPEAAGLEGLTEGAQEAISIAAEKYISRNQDKFNSDDWNRIMESGIKGAVAGFGFGLPGAVASRVKEKYGAPPEEQLQQPAPSVVTPTEAQPDIVGVKKQPADVQEMRIENGLPITGAGEVDTTRAGETLQVPRRPVESRLPTGAGENIGAGAPGVTTNVEPTDGREAQQPIALTQVQEARQAPDTIEFKKWHMGSKVKDENGKPKVVYHGTNKSFDTFVPAETRNRLGNVEGFYFTESPEEASSYATKEGQAQEGANVMPVYLNVANPYDVQKKNYVSRNMEEAYKKALTKQIIQETGSEDPQWVKSKVEELIGRGRLPYTGMDPKVEQEVIKAGGFDGMKDGPHWVAFDSNQIKSASGNIGEFNRRSPNIRFAKEEQVTLPNTGETKESLTDHLRKEFGRHIDTAQRRGTLKIVNDASELEKAGIKVSPNAIGAYSKGTSYIIANRVNKENARKTLLHEVGEHHGLEGMLGKDIYKQVLRQINQANKLDPIVTAAHDHVIKAYPELKQGSDAYLREVLAKVGETAPQNTTWRKVVGAIKNFLIKMGLFDPNLMTTEDIHDMILHSLRTTLKKEAPAGTAKPEVQMAKAGPTNTVDPQNSKGVLDSVGDTIKATPIYNSRLAQDVRNVYSTIPDKLRAIGLSFLSLPQQTDLFGKELPALNDLLDAINKRAGALQQYRQIVDDKVFKGFELLKKYPKPMVDKFNDVAHKLTAFRIDPRKGKDEQENWNDQLIAAWNNIPKELRNLAYEYSDAFGEAREKMIKQVELFAGKSIADQLRTRFEQEKISFYLPLRRKGNYRLSYFDKDGERVVIHKETPAELQKAIKEAQDAQGKEIETHLLTRELNYKDTPPLGFVKSIIDLLDKNIEADINDPDSVAAKESLINEVYKTYLDTFPDESLRQQMRTRQGIEGYIKDIVGGYADVGSKLAHQVSNLEYKPLLDKAMAEVKKNEADYRLTHPDLKDNIPVTQVVQNLIDQRKFLDNPVADSISSRASWFSYMWHIAGNVSSAVVNLTQVPMVVLPMLGGKYGWSHASAMLKEAYSQYTKGGLDVNRKFLPDFTFGANLKPGDKYYNLYHSAVSRSAIRRSVGYELTEMRRRTTEEFTGRRAKIETGLGWIFQNSERMNREVTLIAAYNLAKQSGLSEQAAIDEAIDMTTRTHSHALSEAGPRMFQNGLGKIAFTFKSFAQAQIYNVARLFYLAFKGASVEDRRLAQKQLTGILGMTYAFSGLQGLPTYGAANMFASAVAAMFGDDDEPFDFDEAVRSAVGDIGYKGPLNALTNIDIASRTGFNGMVWHDDPRRLAEVGFTPYFIEHFFGPSYQALFVNPGRAYKLMSEGQVYRGIETVTPSFVRNPMKAFRFATEGAKTTNGANIVDDVSAYSAFMQIFGFNNAELSEAYAKAGSMKKAEQEIMARRTSLLDLHFLAKSNHDDAMLLDIKDKIKKYNEHYPSNKISSDTLSRSYRGHNDRIKKSVDGVYLNKKLKNKIIEEYGD